METFDWSREQLIYEFIDVLNKYQDQMSETTQSDFKGLCEATNTIDEDHPNYGADVTYYLNAVIDITTGLEDIMNQEDQDYIERCHQTIQNYDCFNDFDLGDLVIFNGKPYQIFDIDSDDITIGITDCKYDSYKDWVEPRELKTQCK